MLDLGDSRMAGFTDPRCLAAADERGLSPLAPASRCFEAHARKARDHHRGNRLAACRLCDAAARRLPAAALPRASAIAVVFRAPLDGAVVAGAAVQIRADVRYFAIPRDGYLLLDMLLLSGGAVHRVVQRTVDSALPERDGWPEFAGTIRGMPPGEYRVTITLVSLQRRTTAEAAVNFTVEEAPVA